MSKRDEASYQRFIAYLGETGLESAVRKICLEHHVAPRDIYLDARGPTAIAARLEVWWWLMKHAGKSRSEIGRMFDRDSTSITHAMRKLHAKADELRVDVEDGSIKILVDVLAREFLEMAQRKGKAVPREVQSRGGRTSAARRAGNHATSEASTASSTRIGDDAPDTSEPTKPPPLSTL